VGPLRRLHRPFWPFLGRAGLGLRVAVSVMVAREGGTCESFPRCCATKSLTSTTAPPWQRTLAPTRCGKKCSGQGTGSQVAPNIASASTAPATNVSAPNAPVSHYKGSSHPAVSCGGEIVCHGVVRCLGKEASLTTRDDSRPGRPRRIRRMQRTRPNFYSEDVGMFYYCEAVSEQRAARCIVATGVLLGRGERGLPRDVESLHTAPTRMHMEVPSPCASCKICCQGQITQRCMPDLGQKDSDVIRYEGQEVRAPKQHRIN
jgi:hypothetical protein